ncbi:MAG: amidohydrolase family protein [Candidatus Wallbacteria bacterium]|nr:amidohydrolase family protein [Candidatus Wallbacteria bacterium]
MSLPRVIDIHTHLAGLGGGGTGCFVSTRMQQSLVYHILKWWTGLKPDDPAADEDFAARLAGFVRDSENVDAAVVFGMDGVYDSHGRLVPEKSHLYVPAEHLFRVCRRDPERLLPGPSVNPTRADALEELARVDEAGAVLIKWLAPLQLFDPSEPKLDPFYEELARRGIPLLAHTGCEHTFPDVAHEYGHASLFDRALRIGVTIVFAHCGVACGFHRAHHQTEEVLRMIRLHSNLYTDTSALASFLKFSNLKKIPFADYPGRFVHGSDYPIPALAAPFAASLGLKRTLALTFGANPIEADYQIKLAAGQPRHVFEGATAVLAPRIERWLQRVVSRQ